MRLPNFASADREPHKEIKSLKAAVLLLLGALLTASAQSAVVWTENLNGDLSSNAAAPTAISFRDGSNIINGSVVNPADTRDYVTFIIGADQFLVALTLLGYDDLGTAATNDGNRGFHAINSGGTSFVPGAATAASFLGGDHLTPPVGVNLLPNLANATMAGTGFTVPLGPGTYSYVIQQTGPQHTGYSLDFMVVPEPSSLILLITAGSVVALRRRHNSGAGSGVSS